MGNITSVEHKNVLNLFKENAAAMIDVSLAYTKLSDDHISYKRMLALKDQLNVLSLPTLFMCSQKWYEACNSAVRANIPDKTGIDQYLIEVTENMSLPQNGNGQDVWNVVSSLPFERKQEFIKLLHATNEQAALSLQHAENNS